MMRYNASGNAFSGIPTVVKNLLILNGLVMLVKLTGIAGLSVPEFDDLFGLHFPGSPLFRPYQFLTHMFVHAGPIAPGDGWYLHILLNMFGLYMFGPQVESRWGSQRFLVYYLLCGLGSALLYIGWLWYGAREHLAMLDTEQLAVLRDQFIQWTQNGTVSREITPDMAAIMRLWNEPMVGASGAIYGVLLAFGLLFPNVRLMMLFFPVPIKARYFVIIYALIELVSGLMNRAGDNVAHFAHLGGMVAGFLLLKWFERRDGGRDAGQQDLPWR